MKMFTHQQEKNGEIENGKGLSRFYFFTDLAPELNREGVLNFHAHGLAELFAPLGVASASGKDVAVWFYNAFTDTIRHEWRAFDEIELFETTKEDWEHTMGSFNQLQSIIQDEIN